MLCVKDGFDPARLCQIAYDAQDPKVLGIGLAATRGVASFFRCERQGAAGRIVLDGARPRLVDGSLAPNAQGAMGYPSIPGTPLPTGMAVGLADYDFGPGLRSNDFSGVITRQPPAIRQVIPARMPKVGPDGNETAGVPSVLHQAPLDAYAGWNVVADGFLEGQR